MDQWQSSDGIATWPLQGALASFTGSTPQVFLHSARKRLHSPAFLTQCEKGWGVEPGNEAGGSPLGVSFLGEQCLSVYKELVIMSVGDDEHS